MTDDDQRILEFEESNPRNDGGKEGRIRETFGLSAVRYHQRLQRLCGVPEVIAAYPAVAARVQRSVRRAVAKRRARTL